MAIATVGLFPSACALPTQQLTLPGPITGSIDKRPAGVSTGQYGTPMSNPASPETKEARSYDGTDSFMSTAAAGSGRTVTVPSGTPADGVTLNLAGATIPEAAKTVLGDTLGLSYTVSDVLKGSITLRTPRPISRKDLLATFETLLRAEGAAIQVDNGIHRIVPADAATSAPMRRGGSGGAGLSTDAIALRHVTPDDMQRLLQGMTPQGAKLTGDASRNLLLVAGTSTEIASVREMVAIFDVDWMRGMSFGLFPVESGDPEAIAQELDTIFANDRSSPTKGIVKFVPNRRLKSVLVVTSRREYLDKAEQWMKRIDLVGQQSEKQVNVYRVLNRPANELAVLLQKVYGQQRERGAISRTGLSPGTPVATLTGDAVAPVVAVSGDGRGAAAVNGPRPLTTPTPTAFALPGQAVPVVPAAPVAAIAETPLSAPATATPGASTDDRTSGIEITSDDTNNALIITASSREYKRIRNILSRIDVAPPQVLLEATIAEVTLNDRLAQGVRWFFEKKSSQFTLTDSVVGAIAPKIPGFSYFLNTSNIQVALSALSDITDVNIVSSPSMVVLDNKQAQLQIGDEVPIATQSAVSVLTPGAPIVNSVAFRSTGVILNITPHIGESGRIMLDIEQEVSDVVPTTSSTIDSPTIQQRRIKTKVAVGSGEVIILAGFIQDRARKSRQQVPLLGNIPVVGNLFKDKTDDIRRTELLIAITPHIVQDAQQLRSIASEFRDRMNFTTRPQRTAPPDKREQIDRVLVR